MRHRLPMLILGLLGMSPALAAAGALRIEGQVLLEGRADASGTLVVLTQLTGSLVPALTSVTIALLLAGLTGLVFGRGRPLARSLAVLLVSVGVAWAALQTTSETDGAYAFQDGLVPGQFRLDFSHPGYHPTSRTIEVNNPDGTFQVPLVTLEALPLGTATPTASATVSSTPSATSTLPPTATASPMLTTTATSTPSALATFTGTPTSSATLTATPTFTETASGTATPSSTATATSTSTRTATSTWTATSTSTSTRTATSTWTATSTSTSTRTATPSWTPTLTATLSATRTWTVTATRTATRTATLTGTATATSSGTHTPTSTATPSWTWTPTWTNTPAPTPVGGRPTNWMTCTTLGSSINWGPFSGDTQLYWPITLSVPTTVTGVVVESVAGTGSTTTLYVAIYSDSSGPSTRQTLGSRSGINGSLAGAHTVDVTDVALPAGNYWVAVTTLGTLFTPTCKDGVNNGNELFYYSDFVFAGPANPFGTSPPGVLNGPFNSSVNNWGKAYVYPLGF